MQLIKYKTMNIRIIVDFKYPCSVNEFDIKGKEAYLSDFGYRRDTAPDKVNTCGACGNMKFLTFGAKDKQYEAMEKYGLTIREYRYICKTLREKLSPGFCNHCQ